MTTRKQTRAAALPEDVPLLEVIADGIALYDATEHIKHAFPRRRHRAAQRPKGQKIDAVFVHHSGALGEPGLGGFLGAVRYVMEQKPPDERFPGPPYPFWAPYLPVRDTEGRLVLFRGCEDEYRAWHSGAEANDRGVALCLQGKLGKVGPSPAQVEVMEAFFPWASKHYGLPWSDIRTWLSWHSDAARLGGRAKAACPGAATVAWLQKYLDQAT